jgi:hypothetical protein
VVSAAHCNRHDDLAYVGLGAHNSREQSDHLLLKIAKATSHPGVKATLGLKIN